MIPHFNQLSKLARQKAAGDSLKVALLGDSALQLVAEALRGWGVFKKLPLEIYEAGFNAIDSSVQNPESAYYKFDPQFTWVLISAQTLQQELYKTQTEMKGSFAQNLLDRILSYHDTIQARAPGTLIVNNLLEITDGIFGSHANKHPASFTFQIRKFNFLLMEAAAERGTLHVMDAHGLSQTLEKRPYDPKLWINSSIAFPLDFLPLLTKGAFDIIAACRGKITKALILDLDNTLWGGVIGDDGVDGIKLGGTGVGKAFWEFQLWLKQLRDRGLLLAVCSKNEMATAQEPFEKHPDRVLDLKDFAVFIANWKDKAGNIEDIRESLNIGFDSLVFLDDNPAERERVRQAFPEISVPELPPDPARWISYLAGLNLFETAGVTSNDKKRTEQIRTETKRTATRIQYSSTEDYLKSLEMRARTESFNNFNAPRVAQLTQRSNQFNLRTQRYDENQIKKFAEDPGYLTLALSLRDKFGDYGLVGVIIGRRQAKNLFLDTWILSCRVLGRGVEEFLLDQLIHYCRRQKLSLIIGEYIPTGKNKPCAGLYSKLGFRAQENLWQMEVSGAGSPRHFIKLDETTYG